MRRTRRAALQPSVHPHGRGDNADERAALDVRRGSPPRAWGQSRHFYVAVDGLRFTPTGVGTMSSASTLTATPTVHPHGRGDNPRTPRAQSAARGSPPRAWGQYSDELALRVEERFTPTGVGTMRLFRVVTVYGDGSPPRAWGQLRNDHAKRARIRFTPTGVGTMSAMSLLAR